MRSLVLIILLMFISGMFIFGQTLNTYLLPFGSGVVPVISSNTGGSKNYISTSSLKFNSFLPQDFLEPSLIFVDNDTSGIELYGGDHPVAIEDFLTLSFESDTPDKITIEIFDITGTKVLDERLHNSSSWFVHSLYLSDLLRGVYFLHVSYPNKGICKNLKVQKM